MKYSVSFVVFQQHFLLGLFFRVTKGSKVNLVNQEDKDTRWRPPSSRLGVIDHMQP